MIPVLFFSGVLSIYPLGDMYREPYGGFKFENLIIENSVEREMQEFSAYLRKHFGYLVEMIGVSPPFERAWLQVQELMRRLGALLLEPVLEKAVHKPSELPEASEMPQVSAVSGSFPLPCCTTQPNSPALSSPFSPLGGHLELNFPKKIPAYRVLRELARGSYGVVHLAQLDTGGLIAVKTLDALALARQMTGSWHVSQEGLAKVVHFLEVEFRVLQQIGEHPHIVQLIGSEWQGNELRIAMTYVEGSPLSEYVGMFEEDVAQDVMRQLLEALAHCHQRRVVHSDVKPENIIITAGRKATVLDLGGGRMLPKGKSCLPRDRIFPGTRGSYDDPSALNANLNVVQRDIIAAGRTLRRVLQGSISEAAQRFIERCEQGEAISELLKDPWFLLSTW